MKNRRIAAMALVCALILASLSCVNVHAESSVDALAWWQKTNVYEIYVNSFQDTDRNGYGDIPGITRHLDYLKDLGVGAIWLKVIPHSPQEKSSAPSMDEMPDIEPSFDPGFPVPEDINAFLSIVDKMQQSPRIKVPTVLNRVRTMLHSGLEWFTVTQWAEYHNIDRKNADYECRHFYKKGLLTRNTNDKIITYGFRIAHFNPQEQKQAPVSDDPIESPAEETIGESPPENSMFFIRLRLFEIAGNNDHTKAGAIIRNMVTKQELTFSGELLQDSLDVTRKRANELCASLIKTELIVKVGQHGRTPVYRLTIQNYPPLQAPGPEMMNLLREFEIHPESIRDGRISAYLLSCIADNRLSFTTSEWMTYTDTSQTVAVADIRRALNKGLIRKFQLKNIGTYDKPGRKTIPPAGIRFRPCPQAQLQRSTCSSASLSTWCPP